MVGASLAGLQAAETLRHEGFDGELTLIGAEAHTPYDRPPLSKQFLSGAWDEDRLTLAAVRDDLAVDWRLGVPAAGLDVATRTVQFADGEVLTCDGIVVATGAQARTVASAAGLAGVHVLRTLDDARALRTAVEAGPRHVVVVGAGFIGAEVAATLRGLDLAVTIVEPLDAPLVRALGREVGDVVAAVHRAHGVDVRTGVGVAGFRGDGFVTGVDLTDGSSLDADLVVVGIGAVPTTEWLRASGLTLDPDGGLHADATCRVAPGIVAAGDVVSWPNPVFDGERMRVEHWDHAFDQAAHAARSLLAGDEAEPYAAVPWFWSDQYDRKIQLAGRPDGADEVVVVEGSFAEARFVVLYGRAGRLRAVLGMNRPRAVVQLRPRIAEGISLADARSRF